MCMCFSRCISCLKGTIASTREYTKIQLDITGKDVSKEALSNVTWSYWLEGAEPTNADIIRANQTSLDLFVVERMTLMDGSSYFFEASSKYSL